MNREIKFRAWDKKTESMVEVMNLDYFTNSGCTKKSPSHLYVHEYSISFNGETDSLQYDDISDRFELMQYTGLKDKNGKEIYEGDILFVRYYEYKGLKNEKISSEWTGVVGWNDNGYFINDTLNNDEDAYPHYCLFNSRSMGFEIIGNIYENSELLKSTT